jgi:hypothetical protein
MEAAPCVSNAPARADGTDLVTLQNSHILARFRSGNRDAVCLENALQRAQRSEAAEIDGGSGPIQDYCGNVLVSHYDVFCFYEPLFQRSVLGASAAARRKRVRASHRAGRRPGPEGAPNRPQVANLPRKIVAVGMVF